MRYLLFILLFTGCMLPKETRKANKAKQKVFRLAERYDLRDVRIVRFTDTLYVDSLVIDTFATFSNDTFIQRDTAYITKDRVKVQLVRVKDSVTENPDTVYVHVFCPGDTIHYEGEVEVTTPIVKEAEVILIKIWKGLRRFWWLLVIIIISIFGLSRLARR